MIINTPHMRVKRKKPARFWEDWMQITLSRWDCRLYDWSSKRHVKRVKGRPAARKP